MGASSIAATRSQAKKELWIGAGADHVVTDNEDLAGRVSEITGGDGAAVIFDPIAGPGLEARGKAAAPRGTIIEYGMPSEGATTFPPDWSVEPHRFLEANERVGRVVVPA